MQITIQYLLFNLVFEVKRPQTLLHLIYYNSGMDMCNQQDELCD